MSALSQLPSGPGLGQLFDNFEDLKELIQDWSIKERFSFLVADKDQSCVIYTCVVLHCEWPVRATCTQERNIQVTVLNSEHSCLPGEGSKWYSVAASSSWLHRHIPKYLNVTQATKPWEIIDCLTVQFGERLPYRSACRIQNSLLADTLEAQQDGFRQLPRYVDTDRIANPDTYIRLSSNHETNQFQGIFICPAQSRESFRLCRHFIAVHGTFQKTKFVQTLLLAVTIDVNGHTLLLAWAIVESENSSSWEYFLINLQQCIPKICTEATTLIRDCDKGLISTSNVLAPTVVCAFCCQHLKENFTTTYGRGLASKFWVIARAESGQKFENSMLTHSEIKPAAERYLRNIHPRLWEKGHFPGSRYGHDTSNIVESVNNSLKLDRELSIVKLLNEIWHQVMKQRFERYQSACNSGLGVLYYTKFCTKELGESRIWARQNIAQMANEIHGHVTQPNGNVKIVNLATGTCTCGRYQEYGIPCSHALTCIMNLHQVSKPIFHYYYSPY